MFVVFICLIAFYFVLMMGAATGTRSVLVAFGFVLAALGLCLIVRFRVEIVLFLALLAVLFVVFAARYAAPIFVWTGDWFATAFGERWRIMFLKLAELSDPSLNSLTLYDMSLNIRHSIQEAHWEAFRSQMFFGAGPFIIDAGGFYTYPHNVFIEILSYYGIVGFMIFGAFIVSVTFKILWLARYGPASLALLVGVSLFFSSFVQLQFSFTLWMAKPLFLGAAIVVTLYEFEQQNSRPGRVFHGP